MFLVYKMRLFNACMRLVKLRTKDGLKTEVKYIKNSYHIVSTSFE